MELSEEDDGADWDRAEEEEDQPWRERITTPRPSRYGCWVNSSLLCKVKRIGGQHGADDATNESDGEQRHMSMLVHSHITSLSPLAFEV